MTASDEAKTASLPKRFGSDRNLAWMVMAAGGVSAVVLWTLTENDPYARLAHSDPVPAPIYGPGGDAVVYKAQVISNDDPLTGVARPSPALASVNRLAATISEPEVISTPLSGLAIAPVPQMLGPIAMMADVDGAAPAPALAVRAGFDQETEVAIALEPATLSAPFAGRDNDASAFGRLSAMVAPAAKMDAPLRPHFAADPVTEEALALSRTGRIDVQRRLALAGFDPDGADGVFGPRTREAVAKAQTAWGYPPTGYLDLALHAELSHRTEKAMQASLQRRHAARRAPAEAPLADARQTAETDPNACARDEAGRILAGQSLKCDLTGFTESFGSGGKGADATSGGRRTKYVER